MSILEFHQSWFWVATFSTGLFGLYGLGLHFAKRQPGTVFFIGRAAAIVAMLAQVGAGLVLYSRNFRPGTIHVFYGFVILFTLSFAYIYRPTLAKKPALAYGLLLLFVMGLGLRAFTNVR